MNIYSRAIYLARIEKGLSQKELALKAGIPQPNLSKIEKGRDFKVSTLSQIALALDISVDNLIRGSQPLDINKKKFFQRDNIEKTIDQIVNNETIPKKFKSPAQLIYFMAKKDKSYASKKNIHLAWYNLKKNFSNDEIQTIISKLTKSRQRSS